MITVFGHLEGGKNNAACVNVTFNGGPNGGSVTFTLCDGKRSTRYLLRPNQNSPSFCVNNNSWTFSDFFMSVSLNSICFAGPGDPQDPEELNAFTVERTSDGFSTYAQLNSNFSVNDIVTLSSNALDCYEIMAKVNVFNPSIYPTVTQLCGGGGPNKGGPKIEPT